MQNQNIENYDYEKDFLNKVEEEKKKYKRPNILICGYTGAGKTSIIQALLGEDLVPDNKIGHEANPMTQDYDRYENSYIGIWDSKGLEPDKGQDEFVERTKNHIRKIQENKNVDEHIHIFWYDISVGVGKVTGTDLKIINSFPKESTLVIISKIDLDRKNRVVEAIKRELTNNGIPEDRIILTNDEAKEGIEELYEKSLAILPEAYKTAFEEGQRIDIEKAINRVKEKNKAAAGIIAGATVSSAAIAANPIPISDSLIITPIQIGMIASLAALYGLNKEQLKHQALPLVARTVGMITASSLAKLIPGLGNALNASVAVMITGALGWFVQNQFEKMAIAKVKGEPAPTIDFDFSVFAEFLKNYKKNNDNK
ncbi:DUF697 domain-containing protein [Brachyspira aalborgi]|uniref:DUF697 domain-containing protein n=1 Tax=Brachyspira aalborgi TaxID=29522 RepID=UPI00266BD356|nr:DUF697 domain-containing protein [Brachyspira aalborgi]